MTAISDLQNGYDYTPSPDDCISHADYRRIHAHHLAMIRAMKPAQWPQNRFRLYAHLSDEQVLEMRQRYAAGGVTYQQLAEEYGFSCQSSVGKIVRGERYGDVA